MAVLHKHLERAFFFVKAYFVEKIVFCLLASTLNFSLLLLSSTALQRDSFHLISGCCSGQQALTLVTKCSLYHVTHSVKTPEFCVSLI